MVKKKFEILNEITDSNYKTEQIINVNKIFIILYNKKPFSIKSFNKLIDYPGPKYKKLIFFSESKAKKFCNKLKEKFNSDKFEIFEIDLNKIK